MFDKFYCSDCGAECWRDEVDVGVGWQCGPWYCSNSDCGWCEFDPYAEDDFFNLDTKTKKGGSDD